MFVSDVTHLSNLAGHKKECPECMRIVNLSSKIQQMPSMKIIVMVAPLPITFKHLDIPQERPDEQRQTIREVLNKVPQRVL